MQLRAHKRVPCARGLAVACMPQADALEGGVRLGHARNLEVPPEMWNRTETKGLLVEKAPGDADATDDESLAHFEQHAYDVAAHNEVRSTIVDQAVLNVEETIL